MATATATLAFKISKKMEADYAEFLADCEADRKRGHRPRYCEHGTYLWVDHDPICGGCEDGWTISDHMMRIEHALSQARSRMRRIEALSTHAFELRMIVPGLNIDSILEEIKRLRTV